MDLGLKGKVAAVAASSRGLGRASAEALAREGADVAICSRTEDAVSEAAGALRAHGVRVHAAVLDLTEPGACERFIAGTVEALGDVDILVANNGGPMPGATQDVSLEQVREGLEQNLLVTVRLVRDALPGMRAKGWGRIIAITSSSAKQPIEGLALSNTARAGAAAFLKSLATEVAAEGVTVNTVAPGPHLTDRIRFLAQDAMRSQKISFDEAIAAFVGGLPAKRIGKAEDFGAVVAFLASEQASFITGTTVAVDGGLTKTTF